MGHIETSTARTADRYVSYYAKDNEALDPTAIAGLIKLIIDVLAQCRGGGGVPDRPAEQVAQAMKHPTAEDDKNAWAVTWQQTKQQLTRQSTGLRGGKLKRHRRQEATRVFWAMKDEAAAASIEELTALVKERRAAA